MNPPKNSLPIIDPVLCMYGTGFIMSSGANDKAITRTIWTFLREHRSMYSLPASWKREANTYRIHMTKQTAYCFVNSGMIQSCLYISMLQAGWHIDKKQKMHRNAVGCRYCSYGIRQKKEGESLKKRKWIAGILALSLFTGSVHVYGESFNDET